MNIWDSRNQPDIIDLICLLAKGCLSTWFSKWFIESDGTYHTPDQYTTAKLLRAQLKDFINELSEDEQAVLILRYGLLEDEHQKMYSFDELSDILDLHFEICVCIVSLLGIR